MLSRAAEEISPDSASRFVASADRRTAEDIQNLVRGFAEPLGYSCATTETVVELDVVSADISPVPTPDGYTVATYLNGVPQGLREQVGAFKGLVDAEAPNGTLQWQPTPVSVEQYEAEIGLWRKQGRTAVESIALDGDGAVVAWTCVVTAADTHRPAQIEGTLVLTPHRGRRLGAAVKTASLRRPHSWPHHSSAHEQRRPERLDARDQPTTRLPPCGVRGRHAQTTPGRGHLKDPRASSTG